VFKNAVLLACLISLFLHCFDIDWKVSSPQKSCAANIQRFVVEYLVEEAEKNPLREIHLETTITLDMVVCGFLHHVVQYVTVKRFRRLFAEIRYLLCVDICSLFLHRPFLKLSRFGARDDCVEHIMHCVGNKLDHSISFLNNFNRCYQVSIV